MKALAVIPARGGSQRIKDKNIRPFLGKPMIEYAIQATLQSRVFDRVIVSTDSEKIQEIALRAGASVPFIRPENLADHHTGTHAVTEHAVATLKAAGENYDCVCCIYATNPLLQPQSIIDGFELLQQSQCEHVVTVTHFDFPIQRGLYERSGWVTPINSEMMASRSQDLPECWHDAAQFYWSKIRAIEKGIPLWGDYTQAVTLSRMQVQDIDTPEDWLLAECKFRVSQQGQPA